MRESPTYLPKDRVASPVFVYMAIVFSRLPDIAGFRLMVDATMIQWPFEVRQEQISIDFLRDISQVELPLFGGVFRACVSSLCGLSYTDRGQDMSRKFPNRKPAIRQPIVIVIL